MFGTLPDTLSYTGGGTATSMLHLEKRGYKLGFYTTDPQDRRAIARYIGDIPGVKPRGRRATFAAEPRLLELLLQQAPDIELDDDAREWYEERLQEEEERARLLDREDADIDYAYADKLRPYQRVGADFVAQAGRSLLCDDCGLGKTVQSIAAVEMTSRTKRILIVCPNPLKLFWKSEIEKWSTLDLPVTIVNSPTRESDFTDYKEAGKGWLIINYAQTYRTDRLEDWIWDWVILDEAHKIKNRKTDTFNAVKQLEYRRCVLMTGTPMGNDPSELWAPLNFIDSKHFSSYWRFYEMFVDYWEDWWGGRNILGVRNNDLLRKELASRVAQRKKSEVSDELPPKTYQTIPLELTDLQQKLYSDMATNMLIELENGEDLIAVNAMSKLVRLRQILATTASFDFEDSSCKLDHVMELVEKYDKLVVFTEYRATVEALSARLDDIEIKHEAVLGGMGDEAVDAAVERFQEDEECQVFVSTRATGGTGLTLTAASVLVFVSKPWSAAQLGQAEDRVHRISQDNQVHIISLTCPNTVDDLVKDILNKKVSMTEAILAEELVNALKPWAK